MDPLDQRLSDAGMTWRQSQPEPPDLDRLVATLDRRRSRGFSRRFAFVLLAGLVLLSAVAVAGGVGGIFRNGLPPIGTTTPAPTLSVCAPDPACPSQLSPTPTATGTPAPTSTATEPSDAARAAALVDSYEKALVAGEWQTAFEMLGPTSPTRAMGLAAYAAERTPYYESVAGRYSVGPTQQVSDWSVYAPLIDGADLSRASLIEVDYPALANNNAGYEQFVVAPDPTGTWRIWPVR